jgi:hypothetical protein
MQIGLGDSGEVATIADSTNLVCRGFELVFLYSYVVQEEL